PQDGEQKLADAECDNGTNGADDDGTEQASAGLMRPDARADADESWKRKDGKREQKPAKHADGGKRTENGEDDHGGDLRENRSDGCANHHHQGASQSIAKF